MNGMNIFKTLKRGNQREEEFFSATLAILLEEIPELTSFLIKTLLNKKIDVESLEIILEDTISNGRIDIALKCPHLEIYIENKVSSGLGELQLERYHNHLQNIDSETKFILLTRDYIEDESIKYVNKYILWNELYSLIEAFTDSVSDYVEAGKDKKIYLLEQFLQFLKDEGMSIEKVSWEYSEGVKSFLNLFNMIRSVLGQLSKEKIIKGYSTTYIGNDYAGIYINTREFWIGVYYEDIHELCFDIQDEFIKKYDNKKFEKIKYSDGIPRYVYNFNETYFLAFPKEKQQVAIYNFIKDSINEVNKLIQ